MSKQTIYIYIYRCSIINSITDKERELYPCMFSIEIKQKKKKMFVQFSSLESEEEGKER